MGNVPTALSPGECHGLLARLRGFPRTSLHPSDLPARSRVLEDSKLLLDRMARMLDDDHERRAHRLLSALWEREDLRTRTALNQSLSLLSALGLLEDVWLRANPGLDIPVGSDLFVYLPPVDDHSGDDWAYRCAFHAFTVRAGWLENSRTPLQYLLLKAPSWFASFFPSQIDPSFLGSSRPVRVRLPLDGVSSDDLESTLALWSSDVLSEFFDLEEVFTAVRSLDALEERDLVRGR